MSSVLGRTTALAMLCLLPGMAGGKTRGGVTAPVGHANHTATLGPRQGGFVNATEIYPWSDGAIYRLYTAPGRVSDIILESGETLVSVAAGDTVRWIVGNTTSGTGSAQREHVLVKPTAAGLSTNLLVLTSRRSYNIDLLSTSGSAMASVRWSYPSDSLISLAPPPEAKPLAGNSKVDRDFDPSALNFGYIIVGDDMPWRPVRAFDDGRHVYIEFPPSISASAAPPLFVADGKVPELVNYRMRGHFYVVDRLFDRAELRLGEKSQHVVTISHTGRTTRP